MPLAKSDLRKVRGIIFDFDYTLANSSKGVVKCVNYALKELGFTEFSEEEINKTIGLTLEYTFTQLVGNRHKDKIEKFKHFFIKKADEVMADLTILYKETPYVIKRLFDTGFKLGIVSTKFRYRIETILSRENLINLFDVIVGGEDVSTLKPNPDGLLQAVKKLNLQTSEVFYIGDSAIDAETANKANILFIAVISGVTPKNAFSQYQVIEYLNDLSELPKLMSI